MLNKISTMLDSIADRLEAKGLIKEAYELDKVADEIQRLDFKKPRSIMDSEFKGIPFPASLPSGQSISEPILNNLEELSNITSHIQALCWYTPKAEEFKRISSEFISSLKKLLAQTSSEELNKIIIDYSTPIRNLIGYMNANLPSLGQNHGFESKSRFEATDTFKRSVNEAVDIFRKFITWVVDLSDTGYKSR